ncbi:MAG: cysteine desulfurase family protein [Flavobacteriaceae bacterium]|nr:cysteine desulfurase family protein [Flavobacteriaceae bacterium]CAI8380363.1 MAG: Cysteine desulfurase IscS [Flavobacteriaceae bacterium]|tara:strand:- start:2982 stop:4130 length:1149 start_codon:yes stop_codon:yes gene_type:complete
MNSVYLDNAATTQIRDEVIDKMFQVSKNHYGNPSSTHSFGRSSRTLIESSRKKIAGHLNVSPSEIIFMSGGTEADNCILRSAVRDLGVKHLISSKIEHHAVTHTLDQLKVDYPIEISYVKLDNFGNIDYADLELILKSSQSKTLVSLMHINNEIGNILDMSLVSDLCKKYNSLFHSDTVQSVGHYKLDLSLLDIDFIVASAHKFHGPKGIGFAYIKNTNPIKPLIFGGSQEKGCRAGTESVHNIVGMSEALDISINKMENEVDHIKKIKSYFIDQLKNVIKGVEFNGLSSNLNDSTYTLVNVRFPISKEKSALFLFQLDMKGIACSKGSACQSGADAGSHVLNNVLTVDQNKFVSLRFSFSIYNTIEEIDYVITELNELIKE